MTDYSSGGELSEWILVRTLPDLQRRIESSDDYERLGIAHLIRRLLLDERPVLHQARRRLGLPAPAFSYTPYDHSTTGLPNYLDLYMVDRIADESVTGGLDDFLAAPIGHFQGEPVTVRMLIRFVAHVDGGVHLGRPESDFESYLQQLIAVHDAGRAMVLRSLAAIGVVVIRAIEPLSARITSERS